MSSMVLFLTPVSVSDELAVAVSAPSSTNRELSQACFESVFLTGRPSTASRHRRRNPLSRCLVVGECDAFRQSLFGEWIVRGQQHGRFGPGERGDAVEGVQRHPNVLGESVDDALLE